MHRRSFLGGSLCLSAGLLRHSPARAATTSTHPPGPDFPAEAEHERIAAILASWSPGFTIAKSLASGFLGCSPAPHSFRVVRPGPALEVKHITFAGEPTLGPDAFAREWARELSAHTAHLEVTRLEILPGGPRTRIRYEFTGPDQRVGFWDLEWTGDYRVRRWQATEETRSRAATPWFTDITNSSFEPSPQLSRGIDYWRTVLDGASGIDVYGHNGVSVGDLHGDGLDDLYVCQPAGLPNRLYRNRGDSTFEDVTESSGLGLLDNTACALIADFDNDGRQDMVVVRAAGPQLFLNQGHGKFLRKPDAFHFLIPPQGAFTGAAAADYDRDGRLDIYFCLYAYYQGADQYRYPIPYYAAENGPPNFLMHNNGDGTFSDVTAATGLNANNTRYSFCCGWQDYNQDGWPDLYVVNDFGRKNLYRNKGDGTFTDVAAKMGVEDVGAGMSVCWLDPANLYVGNMWTAAGERISAQAGFQKPAPEPVRAFYRKHAMGNSLFRYSGDTFQDVTAAAQVGMGRWAWSCDSWDFDHDGHPDLYVTNGMLSGRIREDLNSFFWREVIANSPTDAKPSPDYEQGWNTLNDLIRSDYTWSGYERNVFYANNSDGTFSDVSAAVGLNFIEDSRAFALSDFDRDGRLEVFLKNRNAPQLRLVKNVVPELPPSIAFRLRGVKSNRDAIGAVVQIGHQIKSLQAGSGFLSQHTKELFFGLGDAKEPVAATIRWPSGLVQQFQNLLLNHRIFIEEGRDPLRAEPFQPARSAAVTPQPNSESLPETIETWLLAPVSSSLTPPGPRTAPLITLRDASETPGYEVLFRYLFDRHRELKLPASFLLDQNGDIVKVYQGPVTPAHVQEDLRRIPLTAADRLARALPFPGISETYEYGRNNLSFGSAFYQGGYLAQAEAAFHFAARDDSSSAEALYGLGSVYLKQEKLREARESFERATKLTAAYPDTLPNAWNNLGLLATRVGHMDEAVAHFQEALRISPDYWIALENLGNAYRTQKRWEDARQTLERALSARPNDPEANYNLAMVFAQTDNPERAYEHLKRALALRPIYPEALNNLGVLYLRTRRRDAAVAAFEECIRVAPAFDQSYLNLARVYSLEGAPDKARAVLRDLLKLHPSHVQAQKALEQLP